MKVFASHLRLRVLRLLQGSDVQERGNTHTLAHLETCKLQIQTCNSTTGPRECRVLGTGWHWVVEASHVHTLTTNLSILIREPQASLGKLRTASSEMLGAAPEARSSSQHSHRKSASRHDEADRPLLQLCTGPSLWAQGHWWFGPYVIDADLPSELQKWPLNALRMAC